MLVALLELWSGNEICKAAKPRPRGRPRLAFMLLTMLGVRFALVAIRFLLGRTSRGGAVMGGATGTGLRMYTPARAAHPALRGSVEHHGSRAARGPGSVERHFIVGNSADDELERHFIIENSAHDEPQPPPTLPPQTSSVRS
ncbi:hypothetical protein [Achromobacter sp. UMC71]|uniref:hypothetical protein n=1 Tax=Achromobacter sp. UMC71 TaxID=1862320 RepID=UPI001602B3EB|nr:hypothetical protein [Achromobacter sp. UMC71]